MYFNKIVLYLFLLIFSLLFDQAYSRPVPATSPNNEIFYINDRFQQLRCVYLSESHGSYFLQFDSASSSTCQDFDALPRFDYDTLGRINTYFNNKHWCWTVPDTTDVESSYDYVAVEPCTTDNPSQQWIYDNNQNKLYSFSKSKQKAYLGEINYTLAVTTDPARLYSFTLAIHEREHWLANNSRSSSGFAYHLPLRWTWASSVYQLGGDTIYNLSNKHLYKRDGVQWSCLKSQQVLSKDKSWDWAPWETCDDKTTGKEYEWTVFESVEVNGQPTVYLLDADRNLLRMTRTGNYWGWPYTVTPTYSKKDTTGYPVSNWITTKTTREFTTMDWANRARVWPFCPAAGGVLPVTQTRSPRVAPSGFTLNDDWLERFRIIAGQAAPSRWAIGTCGPCFLEALEIVDEIYFYGAEVPQGGQPSPNSGRLFFVDETRHNDILRDARIRDMMRAVSLEFRQAAINDYGALRAPSGASAINVEREIDAAVIEAFLPQYSHTGQTLVDLRDIPNPSDQIQTLFSDMMVQPHNTVWVLTYSFGERGGAANTGSHALVAIRGESGIHIIRTNTLESSATFNANARTQHNSASALYQALIAALSPPPTSVFYLTELSSFNMTPRATPAPLSATYSFAGCNETSASGPGRVSWWGGASAGLHGNGTPIDTIDLNQCGDGGGRCDVIHINPPRTKRSLYDNGNGIYSYRQSGKCQWLTNVNNAWVWVNDPFNASNQNDCEGKNLCSKGGACYRWLTYEEIKPGELGLTKPAPTKPRNQYGYCEVPVSGLGWEWKTAYWYSSEEACKSANKCPQGGACYRWLVTSQSEGPGSPPFAISSQCQWLGRSPITYKGDLSITTQSRCQAICKEGYCGKWFSSFLPQ